MFKKQYSGINISMQNTLNSKNRLGIQNIVRFIKYLVINKGILHMRYS